MTISSLQKYKIFKYRKKFLAYITVFLFITPAFAQKEESSRWRAKINSGTSFYKGNVNKFSTRNSLAVSQKDSVYEFSLYATGEYSQIDKKSVKDEYSGGLKYDFRPFSKISPFLLAEIYSNKQKKIKARYSGLSGVKYTYFKNIKHDLSISVAGQYDHEIHFSPDIPEETFSKIKDILRISIRPKFEFQITDEIKFIHYTFYQPSPLNFNDYRIFSKTTISSKFHKKISIDLDYIYEYDNITVYDSIEKNDNFFYVSLTLNL